MASTTSTKSEEFVAVLPDDSLEAAPGEMPPPSEAANLVPKEARRPRTPTLSPHNHQVRPQRPHLRGGGVAPGDLLSVHRAYSHWRLLITVSILQETAMRVQRRHQD